MRLLLFLITGFIMACCTKPKQPFNTENKFAGVWINKNYMDSVVAYKETMSLFQNITPPFALQLEINNDSTITLNNGFEVFNVAYNSKGDTMEIPSLEITIVNDTLNNQLTTLNKHIIWIQVEPTENSEPYMQAINQATIAGAYILTDKQQNQQQIEFEATGKINGWDNANVYRQCIAADCLTDFEPKCNSMVIHYKNDDTQFFSWTLNGDTLLLTQIKAIYQLHTSKDKWMPRFTFIKQKQ